MTGTRAGFVCLVLLGACTTDPAATETSESESVLVFAAASMRDAMNEVGEHFRSTDRVAIDFSYAGSNVLALQIAATPKADIFVSANESWLDHVEALGRVIPKTRRTLLSNQLMIVAQQRAPFALTAIADLPELAFRYLAIGDPRGVPGGRYARQYLEGISTPKGNVWERVESRAAPSPDVRAALALVESDPEILGIVYATDVATSDRVRCLHPVPTTDGPRIKYVSALLERPEQSPAARRFYDFLTGPKAAKIFQAHGFVAPDETVTTR